MKAIINSYFCKKIQNKMKALHFILFLFSSLSLYAEQPLLLYDKPALRWNSALPLGNGRIGAMVFGDPENEEFQLNEETISRGSPYNNYNDSAKARLNDIRKLVFEDNIDSAQVLAEKYIMAPRPLGKGGAYQPAGSLHLRFHDHYNYSNYRRTLDLSNAVATVSYKVGDTEFYQEAFTSFTDQMLIIRITASRKNSINLTASLSYPELPVEIKADDNTISMTGTTIEAAKEVPGKLNFMVRTQLVNKGGTVSNDNNVLNVKNADELLIYVAMATNFANYHDISAVPQQRIENYMRNVGRRYEKAKEDHVRFYRNYFDRVTLRLKSDDFTDLPTDMRIRDFSGNNDLDLLTAYFQFGRYLMICASQPGTQPMNLQGLWNGKVNPAWKCRYTMNINTEMNYWPAETCNLPEMHETLVSLIHDLSEAGSNSASRMYGCRGWCAHHNTDLWRMTGAVDRVYSGDWPMAGAWLCQHLWTKYIYSGDKRFLKDVYPYMKSASEFFVDYLTVDPRTGYEVVCPSVSPENSPKHRKGKNLLAGITMDNQLVFDLFKHTAQAAEVLGRDKEFADSLLSLSDRLTPLRIGQYGQLQEWAEDWDHPNDHHRHVSHLWGLYPGNEISPTRSAEAANAAKNSLIQRGDPSTGWSMGWKVCLWARLLDGNHAYKLIKNQLTLVPDSVDGGSPGGTYPNMFDAHPPFQIDGNFGCAAGIAEMLVQSHDGFIELLPALPDEWSAGEVCGLRAVGGFVIEKMTWKDGRLEEAVIRSTIGGNLRLRENCRVSISDNGFLPADSANPNPLFTVNTMPVQVKNNDKYEPVSMATETYKGFYDIMTYPNQLIAINNQKKL